MRTILLAVVGVFVAASHQGATAQADDVTPYRPLMLLEWDSDAPAVLDKGQCDHTAWSPDSPRVAFAWQPDPEKPFQVYTIGIDSKDPPQRVKNQPSGRTNTDVDWSPDGKWLVFASHVSSN